MKFSRINLQVLNLIGMQKKFAFPEVSINLFEDGSSNDLNDCFHYKNVILSGEFFHLTENSFKAKFQEEKINLQPEITPETEILICGRYPDWILVEEARLYGITIIFADKAGEFFSRIATKLCRTNTSVLSSKEPIGL